MITPGRARADDHLFVAHTDVAGDQRRAAVRAETPDSGWPTSIDAISADRTAGSGGNGFSLSDSANGFTALGSAADAASVRASRSGVAISPDRPTDRGRTGEVAGVCEGRHHHDVALLDLAVGDGAVQVDRDAGGEQVAALVEGVDGAAPRAAPAPRASSAGTPGWAGW